MCRPPVTFGGGMGSTYDFFSPACRHNPAHHTSGLRKINLVKPAAGAVWEPHGQAPCMPSPPPLPYSCPYPCPYWTSTLYAGGLK
jgi:hypothetical protein